MLINLSAAEKEQVEEERKGWMDLSNERLGSFCLISPLGRPSASADGFKRYRLPEKTESCIHESGLRLRSITTVFVLVAHFIIKVQKNRCGGYIS